MSTGGQEIGKVSAVHRTRSAAWVAAGVLFFTIVGCGGNSTPTQVGKLTSIGVTMSLNDLTSGNAGSPTPTGEVTITESNGQQVTAYAPKSLLDRLRGGQTLEIKQSKGSNKWVVSRIVAEP